MTRSVNSHVLLFACPSISSFIFNVWFLCRNCFKLLVCFVRDSLMKTRQYNLLNGARVSCNKPKVNKWIHCCHHLSIPTLLPESLPCVLYVTQPSDRVRASMSSCIFDISNALFLIFRLKKKKVIIFFPVPQSCAFLGVCTLFWKPLVYSSHVFRWLVKTNFSRKRNWDPSSIQVVDFQVQTFLLLPWVKCYWESYWFKMDLQFYDRAVT